MLDEIQHVSQKRRPKVGVVVGSGGIKAMSSIPLFEFLEQAEIQVKYERYIEKEKEIADRMASLENLVIPDSFDYDKIAALSIEALQKFKKIRPNTIGQASRISGVNPSDVQILMVYMGR